MKRAILFASLLAFSAGAAQATDSAGGITSVKVKIPQQNVFVVRLDSYQEAPLTLVTPGTGTATLRIQGQTIQYVLNYGKTEGLVTQSHIHVGRTATAGGIAAFLCSNLGNGPAGTPACPPAGKISGTIKQATGPATQGVDNIAELIKAIRAGAVYVNVHTVKYPGGEIRGDVISYFGHHH